MRASRTILVKIDDRGSFIACFKCVAALNSMGFCGPRKAAMKHES